MTGSCFICGNDNERVLVSHQPIPEEYVADNVTVGSVTLCANCRTAVEKLYDETILESTADAETRSVEDVATTGFGNFRGPQERAVLQSIIDLTDDRGERVNSDGIPYSEITERAARFEGVRDEISASKVGQIVSRAEIKKRRFRDGTRVVDPDAAEKAADALGQ